MDDERQAGLARRCDVLEEAFALRGAWRLVVEVVEPSFADADALRMLRQPRDLRHRHVELLVRAMRMRADGEVDVGVRFRDRAVGVVVGDDGRDRHELADACRPRAREHVLAIALEIRVVEVAVVVDEHRARFVPYSPFLGFALPFGCVAAAAASSGST